jgi:hypothetical protein
MKKRLFIIIPTIAVLAILVALLMINNQQTPAWKTRLNQYLAYLHVEGEPSYQLVSAVQAARPRNFISSMSAGDYSDSLIFLTDFSSQANYSTGLEPIPFPPDDIWCALIKNGGHQQVVYVALHNSLYNADWIVHESPDPWGSPSLNSTLDSIGCSFE